MIKSAQISNFQSHKETTLEFSPGVNIIVGNSDSGKSSIVRALRWLIWNRPTGDDFRSDWGGETKVNVITDTHEITRRKDKTTINEYVLSGIKDPFKAFGTDVPEEVKRALNVNEINMQFQLDQHFLLSSTPGEVAQHFNRIAHIDQIDIGIRKVQQWINGINQDITARDKQLIQFQEELETFADLDKFEIDVEVLEGMQENHQNTVVSRSKLNVLIVSIQSTVKDIEAKSDVLKAEKQVSSILRDYEGLYSIKDDRINLKDLINEITDIKEDIEELKDILGASSLVNNLIKWTEEKTEIEKGKSTLVSLVRSVQMENITIEGRQKLIIQLEEKFEKLMPPICPLCNQKIK